MVSDSNSALSPTNGKRQGLVTDSSKIKSKTKTGLFKERIKVLDKKVQPGLTRLNWSQNSFSDFYIGDCRVHASKVMAIVTEYKQANQQIAQKCRQISESLLVSINNKRVYEELQFKVSLFM